MWWQWVSSLAIWMSASLNKTFPSFLQCEEHHVPGTVTVGYWIWPWSGSCHSTEQSLGSSVILMFNGYRYVCFHRDNWIDIFFSMVTGISFCIILTRLPVAIHMLNVICLVLEHTNQVRQCMNVMSSLQHILQTLDNILINKNAITWNVISIYCLPV